MTIDCSATASVILLGWILHPNLFIIYVPNSCQCHLEAVWLVIHHALSFTVVINIVMGWTFTIKLPGGKEYRSPLGGSGHSIRESTEGRLSGVLGIRHSPERSLAHPLPAINLCHFPPLFLFICFQIVQKLSSSYAASLRKKIMLFFHCP